MAAIMPIDTLRIGQSKKRFVDQRRWLKKMSRPFASKAMPGDLTKLWQEQLEKPILRPSVAAAPLLEQNGDFARVFLWG
jgi:hypothetical protein